MALAIGLALTVSALVPGAVWAAESDRPALGSSDSDAVGLEHPSQHLRVNDFPAIDEDLESWQRNVTDIQHIEIPASADDSDQKALYFDSGSEDKKPLLLVLHSWSSDYLQSIDIPLAQFAVANDWVFMHPDFRGQNDGRPEAMASELAISDMQDALDYARENATIDENRIYVLGYSGGAMNALHLASRQPNVFAGVAAWVPVYDLETWYQWNEARGEKYAGEIVEGCGGEPGEGNAGHEECVKRSPVLMSPMWQDRCVCSSPMVSRMRQCPPSRR
ncbi:prolyl oligopeptidase family serine peptidase [Halomonas sp. Bachu 37]|uniref:alpha/beta hydrolase family protein n=1 Tax=Halomonas kashgarensis TaxID=3084920 RepID=UPI003217C620